jgi:hypothetical protein
LSFCAAFFGGVVPSGYVPGGDIDGHVVKFLVGGFERWLGTRLLSPYLVQCPFHKVQGHGRDLHFFYGSCVRARIMG